MQDEDAPARKNQPQQEGPGVVVGQPPGNHLRKRERERGKREGREKGGRREREGKRKGRERKETERGKEEKGHELKICTLANALSMPPSSFHTLPLKFH